MHVCNSYEIYIVHLQCASGSGSVYCPNLSTHLGGGVDCHNVYIGNHWYTHTELYS